jgi:hypothetical protein
VGVGEANELWGSLREGVGQRLASAGWVVDDATGPTVPGVSTFACAFSRPVANDVVAVVVLEAEPDDYRPEAIGVSCLTVGVNFGPLRRATVLLGGWYSGCLLVDDTAWELVQEGDPELSIRSAHDVLRVADRLSAIVLERGVAFASRFASVDALIAELNRADDPADIGDDPIGVDLRLPAVLAAAGRFDDAHEALERWQPVGPPGPWLDMNQQIVAGLRRWINDRGNTD